MSVEDEVLVSAMGCKTPQVSARKEDVRSGGLGVVDGRA